jgi:hypothetical protein
MAESRPRPKSAAFYDAELLLAGLDELPDPVGARRRLIQELQRSIARNSAIAARAERTLAAVLEALEARPE